MPNSIWMSTSGLGARSDNWKTSQSTVTSSSNYTAYETLREYELSRRVDLLRNELFTAREDKKVAQRRLVKYREKHEGVNSAFLDEIYALREEINALHQALAEALGPAN